jgi:Asp-tRNA(Asn)/Glu-tRNA(Gln) amidotransferase A subunit family amidase
VGFSADLGFAHPDLPVADLVRRRLDEISGECAVELAGITVRLADPAGSWLALADLEAGRPVDPGRLDRAYEVRRHNDAALASIFETVDVLVTPATPQTAFPLGKYEANLPAGDLCWAFNLSGHPAVTVPAGLLNGLPVGLHAIAPHHRDDLAVAVGALAAAPLPDPPVFCDWAARLD